MTDAETSERALEITQDLRHRLRMKGFDMDDSFPSGNVEGGWIVEGEMDGFTINVEVVGGPWRHDGTYEEES